MHIRVIRGRRKTAVITFLGLLVTSLGISQMVAADSLPNTGVPAGFSINSVAEGFDMPTVAQFAPDGRIFVAQKDGVIKIVKNGQTLAQPFYVTPKVNNYVDRGLLGMTLDPNFASNHYVYLFYTYDNQPGVNAAPKTGRLIRVTASGDTAIAGSEQVILGTTVGTSAKPSCENYAVTTDCIPADGLSHGPDTVLFGPDGKLYVSIGDSASYDNVDMKAFRAQNLDSLSGKILRINPDGTAPADNPFYTGNPSDNKSKVYAYGLRNPFRFSIRDDGVIVVGDVGWSLWEEVNVVFPGANFGWPCYEGNEQQNGTGGGTGTYKDLAACQQMYAAPPDALSLPKLTYPHPPGSAIVGGTFYDGTNYPAEYQGRYFYGDYAKNQVYALQLDGNDDLVPGSNMTFANNAGGPVSFFKGPDGDLYYVGIITGAIYHLAYSTGNQAPTAFAAANKTYGPAPLTVDFTSAGSFDPEGDPLTYAWNFGDGTTSNEVNPTHTYTANGTYTATLTVEDTAGNASTKTVLIYPGASAPTVTITSPTNMSAANAGDTINLAGSATDTKDGAMPGNKLHWNVVIQHCPLDSCHAHTVTSFDGATGSFAFPAHDGPFYIQIALSTTNSIGLTTTKTINVYPVGQKITSALQFDGINDYAKSANPADFKLQQFTVEAMVKTFSTGANGSEVISQGDNWSMRVLPSGGIAFAYANGSFWEYFAAESAQVKDGLWHHIAATKTSTGVKLYVDGAPVLNEADMLPIEYKYGADLVVGAHGTYDDQFYFNGAIDELRVWTTPRTDAQIAQYRSQTLPTGTTGLTAYYKADEGTGTTAKDSSVAGTHTLSFVNGANWTAGAPLSDPPTTPGVNTIKDTFTGTTLDAAKWTKFGTASRTVQNGDLTISPATSGTGWHGITSKATYELKNNAVFVEVPKTTNGNVPAETQLVLEKDANNRVLVIRSIYGMVFRSVVNGAFTDTGVAYNATNMRWWRIRETTGKVYFETSADATTWTVRRTINDPFDLSKVKVLLDAGTYQSTSNPGTAKFDNLNTLPAAQAGASALQLTMPQ